MSGFKKSSSACPSQFHARGSLSRILDRGEGDLQKQLLRFRDRSGFHVQYAVRRSLFPHYSLSCFRPPFRDQLLAQIAVEMVYQKTRRREREQEKHACGRHPGKCGDDPAKAGQRSPCGLSDHRPCSHRKERSRKRLRHSNRCRDGLRSRFHCS